MLRTFRPNEHGVRETLAVFFNLLTADGRLALRQRKALTRLRDQSTLTRTHLDTAHAQASNQLQHLSAERVQAAVVNRALDDTQSELQSLKQLHRSLLEK